MVRGLGLGVGLGLGLAKFDDATDRLLRLSLKKALNVGCHRFSFKVPFLVLFALPVIKVSLLTTEGEMALKHLLIKDWDASRVNHAVNRYYNAHTKAIGYFIRLRNDQMKVQLKCFDFTGFNKRFTSGVQIRDTCFEIGKGLNKTIDNKTGDVIYGFDISKEFDYLNISKPVKRLLSLTLNFTLQSVRARD
ncbi:hypothetical protein DPMN_121219 [Dreissena polymorpha]|uniref:Uncharacterized protein n=1 Tax=Dreissena polymorpha TaxID=45954 RepID=A0A9D4GT49_DREPO|nr:hypothetical protein DPMN_121219 [Dreissena polymorpha]